MGPDGAVSIIFRKELAQAEDPVARKAELVEEYRLKFANPYVAASRGYIDDVIEPHETRPRLINGSGNAGQQARCQPGQETRLHSLIEETTDGFADV